LDLPHFLCPPLRAPPHADVTSRRRTLLAMDSELSALSPAQLALALNIILVRLPVKTRLRCAEVCRAWRDAAAERSLWLRLDLREGFDRDTLVSDALLRAAAARAGGQLQALDFSRSIGLNPHAVLDVLRANADTLRELRMGALRPPPFSACLTARSGRGKCGINALYDLMNVAPFAEAAPQLRVLEIPRMYCSGLVDAHRLLHREPPFQALLMKRLSVELPDVAALHAFLADLPADPPVRNLVLPGDLAQDLSVMSAMVDAALACRLPGLLFPCNLRFPGAHELLARLLGGSSLTELSFCYGADADELAMRPLCDALRANATLTSLAINGTCRTSTATACAVSLLHALLAHRSLRSLDLHLVGSEEWTAVHRAAVGAALGTVVAANAAALEELNIAYCALHDDDFGPLVDALPRNTRLRTLRCHANFMTEAFARERLLPAVRANTSLRLLYAGAAYSDLPSAREAELLVDSRL
jgi:hypothetical protein